MGNKHLVEAVEEPEWTKQLQEKIGVGNIKEKKKTKRN